MVRGETEALEEAVSPDGERLGPIIRIHPSQSHQLPTVRLALGEDPDAQARAGLIQRHLTRPMRTG